MESVIELHAKAILSLPLETLENQLGEDREKTSLVLSGMGALILQSTHDYLHCNHDSHSFCTQVQHTPRFDIRYLEETLTPLPPTLLTLVLGSRLKIYTQQFMAFYALSKESATRLFSLSSAMVFGMLNDYLRCRSPQSPSLKSWLDEQHTAIAAAQPKTVLNVLPVLIPADPPISRTGSLPPPKRRRWPGLFFLLTLLMLASLLFSIRGFSGLKQKPESYWVNQGEYFDRRLADGKELLLPQQGMEARLVSYLDSNEPIDEQRWFTFDRLLFDVNSFELAPESQEQLKNLVDILRAYPNVEIKLGGYTDNTGTEEMNRRLSQDRADTVRMALIRLGIDERRIDTEGYGSTDSITPNDTEENRAKNRRIALNVVRK